MSRRGSNESHLSWGQITGPGRVPRAPWAAGSGRFHVVWLALAFCGLLGRAPAADGGAGTGTENDPRAAARALAEAVKLLEGGRRDQGIQLLEGVAAGSHGEVAAKKAREVLLEFGVGKDVRVTLVDRKVFREAFKIPDRRVLELAEKCVEEVGKLYEKTTPFFASRKLQITFYDSEARYRKEGGLVNAAGHFSAGKPDYRKRSFEGSIKWYLPRYAATLKDRELCMRGTLLHESAHYWNTTIFGGSLPSVLEEGIASYLQSRLSTEYFQYYRTTERLEVESSARNALNNIAEYSAFLELLEAARGFGQGGEMVSRWYGLCYAIVDLFEEGEVGGKRSSFESLLGHLKRVATESAAAAGSGQKPAKRRAKDLLESAARELYGATLEELHAALVDHVLKRYRQR